MNNGNIAVSFSLRSYFFIHKYRFILFQLKFLRFQIRKIAFNCLLYLQLHLIFSLWVGWSGGTAFVHYQSGVTTYKMQIVTPWLRETAKRRFVVSSPTRRETPYAAARILSCGFCIKTRMSSKILFLARTILQLILFEKHLWSRILVLFPFQDHC
jgi:hypothetical protein